MATKTTYNLDESYIRIDPNYIGVCDQTNHKLLGYLSTKDLQQIIHPNCETPILPYNCIYYRQNGHISIYVIEEKPGTKHFTNEWTGQQELQHPYLYYVCVFLGKELDVRILVNDARISSLDTKCAIFKFQNSQSRVCLGDAEDYLYKKSQTEICNLISRVFWDSNFNDELGTPRKYEAQIGSHKPIVVKVSSREKNTSIAATIKSFVGLANT